MKKTKKKNMKSDRKYVNILGIKVISTSIGSVLRSVEEKLSHNSKFYIVTPNPELVLMAQNNFELRRALNAADLPIPDGVGLKLAIPGLPIIKGRELFIELVELTHKNNWKIFFLGGLNNEAEIAAKKLHAGYAKGPKLGIKANPVTGIDERLEKDAIEKINKFAPHLLFVAFGNPKQEIWIHKNLNRLKIGGAMAVGGTFRYIAGMSKLPPKWMEEAGLEWLWRLFTEPFRFKRIWNALAVFPLKVFQSKVKGVEYGTWR